jgi:glycosyltransferase involved in cell wall biosynthesis
MKFTVIIPTIWKTDNIYDIVDNLIACSQVSEIIVIDNDYDSRRKSLHPFVTHVINDENVFVNAAWNQGVKLAKYDYICLLNDDIYASVITLKDLFSKFDKSDGLVGVHESCYTNTHLGDLMFFDHKEVTYGFGCLMMFHKDNYYEIPETLKIAYGDNWLIEHNLIVKAVKGIKLENRPKMSTSVTATAELTKISDNDKLEWDLLHSKDKATICLNMIVKNESHIIEKTLQNICDKIDISYWVICDTGSSDGTSEIIKRFFKEKNIPGELHNDTWIDFGFNRTSAIQKAKDKADYILIFDADDELVGDINLNNLMYDMYNFKFGPGITYYRPLLIKSGIDWKWFGVIHEFLGTASGTETKSENISGDYYVISGRTGYRSFDPNKYKKDAKILTDAYKLEESYNGNMMSRYAFYAAQSYKDSGQPKLALEWYIKRTKLGSWYEEIYQSYLTAGTIAFQLGKNELGISLLLDGQNMHNERSECYYHLANHYRIKNKHKLAYVFAKLASKTPRPINGLFVNYDVYDYLIDFEIGISAYYIGQWEDGKAACLRVIEKNIPSIELEQAKQNLKCYE